MASKMIFPRHFKGPLSDKEATDRVVSARETMPKNRRYNKKYPRSSKIKKYIKKDLWTWRVTDEGIDLQKEVTGRPTERLTTDEIIQWTSHKWGLDEDMMRAQAMYESGWDQKAVGDFTSNFDNCPRRPKIKGGKCGESYGLYQMKVRYTAPSMWQYHRTSTPFNADYAAMIHRITWNGHFEFFDDGKNVSGSSEYGSSEAMLDAWGPFGSWYSGFWNDGPALRYIQSVKQELKGRTWERL